jgi:hypothetical protein
MKSIIPAKVMIFLVSSSFAFSNFSAQDSWPPSRSHIDTYRQKILSPDIKERAVAAQFLTYFSAEEIGPVFMNKIIDLLLMEEDRLNKTRKALGLSDGAIYFENLKGEAGAEYIGDLCFIVGKSGNIKMLPLLIKYAVPGKALVGYGEEAVDYYFEGIKKSSSKPHAAAFYLNVLGYWLQEKKEGYTARGETRNQIKAELIKRALSDNNYTVKSSAIEALSKIDDEDLISIFKRIASNDPWHLEEGLVGPTDKEPSSGKKVLRYPLREIAQKELEKRRKYKFGYLADNWAFQFFMFTSKFNLWRILFVG